MSGQWPKSIPKLTYLVQVYSEQVRTLKARVSELEAQLGMSADFLPPLELELTAMESRYLQKLMTGRLLAREALLELDGRWEGDPDMPELKIVDVFICKLRKKLKPHNIGIRTLWGRGYLMEAEDISALHGWIAQGKAA